MFLDKVTITIKAGNGGNGHVSFFRDKMTMHGGPDGGNGGKGGDVVFVGTTREDNLVNFRYTKKFFAGDGVNGGKRNMYGAGGVPMLIPVPLGTRVYKLLEDGKEGKELLADIVKEGQEFRALRGGAGGLGNAAFATAKKKTPNFSQTGIVTKPYQVRLELNTIADVGLVGFPNVGKSSILSVISRANPKIGNYHFTTLHPNVGITNILDKNMIVADIPGLIENASDGVGLGHDFLRHVMRTRLLVHVVDIAQVDGRCAVEDFEVINRELGNFSDELGKKPQIVALNKCDVADAKNISAFKKKYGKKYKIFEISAATNDGVKELFKETAIMLQDIPRPDVAVPFATLEERVDKNEFHVRVENGEFIVEGPMIDNLIRGVVLSDTESNYYFQRRIVDSGIVDELKKQGMKQGDTVHIKDIEFEWVE
ncbi:MAG: GTPase ObgE [Firmicutes bacterium]|nr:GTPase ObgE [Bacillota bacterium]